MTSVLKLCLQCYQHGIYKRDSKQIATNIVGFLSKNINVDHSLSCFLDIYNLENYDNKQSRLAWCYGDLTIAYVLYQYGSLFKEKNIEELVLKILVHFSKRRSDKETFIVDAGVCHGMSDVLNEMKELGFPIKYDRCRCTYYYDERGEMVKNLFIKDGQILTKDQAAKIGIVDNLCFSEVTIFELCKNL